MSFQGQGGGVYPQWSAFDPRASSSQSLAPSARSALEPQDARRTLLIVYIHGFMGNESSFRSFPAHVHGFLKNALAETHVIHSKIYPRYKTYKAIEVARDNFSAWLQPHEAPTTDVILVGHSMGGLLAADVALMPRHGIGHGPPFQHRILGTISLDAPLLGLHPGIIVSGLASLFRLAPSPHEEKKTAESSQRSESSASVATSPYLSVPNLDGSLAEGTSALPVFAPPRTEPLSLDPHFNPPFFNDIVFRDRGWLKNVAHFANKHKSENLVEAAKNHVLSHLEFGGCMADYNGLHTRYDMIRALEDVDDLNVSVYGKDGQRPLRVRFVNYYTLSTGRLDPDATRGSSPPTLEQELEESLVISPGVLDPDTIPRISLESGQEESGSQSFDHEYSAGKEPLPLYAQAGFSSSSVSITTSAPSPPAITDAPGQEPPSTPSEIPAIPALPPQPVCPDLTQIPDREAQSQAERDFKRAQKAYQKAVKEHDKAITERQRLVEKRRRKAAKEAERCERERRKDEERQAKEAARWAGGEKKKDRKFCTLPPKKADGSRDATWVPVRMEGVDEVGAHCGLFVPDAPHYERLVGDVGWRIQSWVQEEESKRTILELD